MWKNLTIEASVGLAVLLTQVQVAVSQTGPVREGLRRTGEAVAEGTRATVRGSRNVVGRAGQEVRGTVDNTTEAARAQVDRLERSELRVNSGAGAYDNNYNADVQAGPARIQADGDLDADPALGANAQLQGDPNIAGDPNMQGRYESGFRGADGQFAEAGQQPMNAQDFRQGSQVEYNGRLHSVRYSRDCRPYICVRGCPVYLDQQPGGAQQHQAYRMSDDPMQQNGVNQSMRYDQSGQPIENSQQFQNRQESFQGSTYQQYEGNAPAPQPPAPPSSQFRSDIDSSNRSLDANTRIGADQDLDGVQNPSRSGSADIDAETSSSFNSQQRTDLNATTNSAQDTADTSSDQSQDSSSNQLQDSSSDQSQDSSADQDSSTDQSDSGSESTSGSASSSSGT